MFKKTIEALKAAEEAVEADLKALWVEYDPATGGGGVFWHAAGSGILQNAQTGLAALRSDLEKRQANADAAQADAEAAAAAAAPDVDATPAALAHAEEMGVDITQVEGTGAEGRVTKADVAAAAEAPANA